MKELELVISGLRVDMPHKVIDYRILDVLEALDKRLVALEGDGEDNAEVIQDHQLRLTDIEEKFERSLSSFRDMKGIYKDNPAPLSCCEGCAEFPCETSQILKGDAPGWTPDCYREKHICGECVRPFWNEAYGNGWCLAGKDLPVDRDDEACADFVEVTQ